MIHLIQSANDGVEVVMKVISYIHRIAYTSRSEPAIDHGLPSQITIKMVTPQATVRHRLQAMSMWEEGSAVVQFPVHMDAA